jgi:hypothetical protein
MNPPDGYALIRIPEDWERHPVFITDDGIVPTCDICEGPQRVEGDDWNGNTGNHFSCEERIEEENYVPCPDCGSYPGDPHNGEAHLAEMRYEPDPYDFYEDNDHFWESEIPFDKCVTLEHGLNTSGRTILFGPNADTIVYADEVCSDCDTELVSDWEPKGYRVTTDSMIVYREEFTKLGRKHMWTDEARFAVYEKVQ